MVEFDWRTDIDDVQTSMGHLFRVLNRPGVETFGATAGIALHIHPAITLMAKLTENNRKLAKTTMSHIFSADNTSLELEQYGIPIRILNQLAPYDITTIVDLLSLTMGDITGISGINKPSLQIILNSLAESSFFPERVTVDQLEEVGKFLSLLELSVIMSKKASA